MAAEAGAPDKALDAVFVELQRRTGLVFAPHRRERAAASVRRAMLRACVADAAEFSARLAVDDVLLDGLASDVTIGETYFFREPKQFSFLERELFPGLVAAGTVPRVWSAGCASGEEAYSLVIALLRSRPASLVRVTATDVSRAALRRAAEARYSQWSLRDLPDELIGQHFTTSGREFVLDRRVHGCVSFAYHNLAADPYPSIAAGLFGMDLIMCRNVLIYFDEETIARVTRQLVATLRPGGWLMLGASDPPLEPSFGCAVVRSDGGFAYRRPDGAAGARHASIARAISVGAEARSGGADHAAASTVRGEMTGDGDRAIAAPTPRNEQPADEMAWAHRVETLAGAGQSTDADRACLAALDAHPHSAYLTFLHAAMLAEAGQLDDALDAARRALYLDRELTTAHLLTARIRRRLGDLPAARRALEAAERSLDRAGADDVVRGAGGERAAAVRHLVRAQVALMDADER